MTSAAGSRVAGVVVNIQVTYMKWSSLKTGNQALLCLAGGSVLTLVNPAAANAAQRLLSNAKYIQ